MTNIKTIRYAFFTILFLFLSGCATTNYEPKDVRSVENRVLITDDSSEAISFARKLEAAINADDKKFVGDTLLPQSEIDKLIAEESDPNAKEFMQGFMEGVKIGILNQLMQEESSMGFLRAYEGAQFYNLIYALDLQDGEDFDYIEFIFNKQNFEFEDFFSYTTYVNFEKSFEDIGLVIMEIVKNTENGKNISAISEMDNCENLIQTYEKLSNELQNIRKQFIGYANCAIATGSEANIGKVLNKFNQIAVSNTDMPFMRALFAILDGDLNKAYRYIDLVSNEMGGDLRLDLYKFSIALELENFAVAKATLADALQKYPNSENVYFSSMDLHLTQKNYGKLLSVFLYMNEAFGYNYSPELIKGFEGFEDFSRSQVFLDWEKSQ